TIFLELPMSRLVNFDYKTLLLPPPANTDPLITKELEILHNQTKKRSSQDLDFIYSIDQDLDKPFMKLLNKYNLNYPQQTIKEYYDIVYPILLNVKGFWNRPRPYQLAKFYNISINSIITDTTHTASYPSGHTVYSSLIAYILKDIYPELGQFELDKIVDQTALARVMQGVHYPSDNAASLIFTKKVFNHLKPQIESMKEQL
ncbi:MAG: phosphatase PAP2 family protein, partial [Candidatus Nitrosotenuis sp.]